jgi:hypothetical protein
MRTNTRSIKITIQFGNIRNVGYTECPTRYRTQHFFNNSDTNEDIATKFKQEYFRCVRNKKECVCSVCLFRCNIFIGVIIIKEMPGLVASGTPCISLPFRFVVHVP